MTGERTGREGRTQAGGEDRGVGEGGPGTGRGEERPRLDQQGTRVTVGTKRRPQFGQC